MTLPILTGLQLIVKDLSRALQWTANQGVEALLRIAVAGLPADRGLLLLASEAVV
jgi:hypothetical protein